MITSRQAKVAAGNPRPETMARRAFRVAGITAVALGLAAAFACGSSKSGSSTGVDSGTPCNANPWECPSGQVCWPISNAAFACLPSGTAQAGDTCSLMIGAATCSDGLNCLATADSGVGFCSPYCDLTGTSHECPATAACETVSLPGGASFNACVPFEEGGTSDEAGASETDASGADVSASDASASDTGASDAHASDASADVVVGE